MKKAITLVRILVVLLVFTAVISQFLYSLWYIPTFTPANFFSFFTIESNLFAATVLLISAYISFSGRPSRRLEYFRGAATLYMVVVGIIYFLLLRGFEASLNTTLPWVNFILHYVFPVAIVIDWVVTPLTHKLHFKYALVWLIYPLVYLVYSLIRGAIVNWYPYPFLNPTTDSGSNGVIIITISITILCTGLTWLITRKKTAVTIH